MHLTEPSQQMFEQQQQGAARLLERSQRANVHMQGHRVRGCTGVTGALLCAPPLKLPFVTCKLARPRNERKALMHKSGARSRWSRVVQRAHFARVYTTDGYVGRQATHAPALTREGPRTVLYRSSEALACVRLGRRCAARSLGMLHHASERASGVTLAPCRSRAPPCRAQAQLLTPPPPLTRV